MLQQGSLELEMTAKPLTKQQAAIVETFISEARAEHFDWCDATDDDIVVTHQPAIAIYTNAAGHIVIRQRDDSDEDRVVTIAPANIQAVIDRLVEWRDTLVKP